LSPSSQQQLASPMLGGHRMIIHKSNLSSSTFSLSVARQTGPWHGIQWLMTWLADDTENQSVENKYKKVVTTANGG
jgi:hypothetical protein